MYIRCRVKEAIGESVDYDESVQHGFSTKNEEISEIIQSGSQTHTRFVNSVSQGHKPPKGIEKPEKAPTNTRTQHFS